MVQLMTGTALWSAWAIFASAAASDGSSTTEHFSAKCAGIASQLSFEHGIVHFAEFVAAGTNLSLAQNDPTCAQAFVPVTADMCRVVLSVSTSNRSGLNMEAWLPSNWTGRFLSGGSGGLNGCIR